MPETLQEFVGSSGESLRLDQEASVLRGVKLLGLESRNGRVYREQALRNAIRLYEGARVNVNHPKGDPLAPRDYQDRLGVIHDVELRAGLGLYGVLRFNPKHPLAEQLVWDAEHSPENVGLSHNVLADTRRDGEQVVVESIVHVQSVDLVADPATTSGLFEQQGPSDTRDPAVVSWSDLTHEAIEEHRPDLLASIVEQRQSHIDQLQEQVHELTTAAETAESARSAYELLAEHGLMVQPGNLPTATGSVSRGFFDALLTTPDERAMRSLVEQHADVLHDRSHQHAPQAVSAEQAPLAESSPPTQTVDEFVTAIAGR